MLKLNSALNVSLVTAALLLPTIAEAGVVTGPPVAGFTTADNSKDNVLTNASPNFSADLSTFGTFTSE